VDRLQAPLEAWRSDLDGIALWGRSLALLEGSGGTRGAQRRERQLEGLEAGSAPIQWSLAAAPARDLLQQWLPWRRLATLAGGPLDDELRGLAVALEPAADGLRMRGWLDYGAAA
jgi:hypothetical protein